jgi:hypothetical protein
VRGKWLDWDDDATPKAQSTRTVDTKAQDGEIRGTEGATIQSTNANAPNTENQGGK